MPGYRVLRRSQRALRGPGRLLAAALLAAGAGLASAADYVPRDGDIIFHASRSTQSRAVQAATHSRYSHMGLVLVRAGKPVVLEAVQPVKYTPLAQWQARGEGGHYVVKRLKAPLPDDAGARLQREATRYLGKPYDLTFEWSDKRIYCSELVWKLYRDALGIELAPLARLDSFDLSHPAVRAKLKERYGARVPLAEPVIAPSALFAAPLLEAVAEE